MAKHLFTEVRKILAESQRTTFDKEVTELSFRVSDLQHAVIVDKHGKVHKYKNFTNEEAVGMRKAFHAVKRRKNSMWARNTSFVDKDVAVFTGRNNFIQATKLMQAVLDKYNKTEKPAIPFQNTLQDIPGQLRAVHAGHIDGTFNAGMGVRTQVQELVLDRLTKHSRPLTKVRIENAINNIFKKYKVNIDVVTAPEKTRIKLVPQVANLNQKIGRNIEGPIKRQIIKDIIHYLENDLTQKESKILHSIDFATVESSPSIVDRAFKSLEDEFLEKKSITKKTKRSNKSIKSRVPKSNVKTTGTDPKFTTLRDVTGRFTSLLSLANLINLRLHDQIQSNMGKGSAREILNYRTGRLARSAKVSSLTRTRQDSINIPFDYMTYPYQAAFGPGGWLHRPGRDPDKLISKSIRQLGIQLLGRSMRINPIAPD